MRNGEYYLAVAAVSCPTSSAADAMLRLRFRACWRCEGGSNRNGLLPTGRWVRTALSSVRSPHFLWDYRRSPCPALDRLSSKRVASTGHHAQRYYCFWPSCPAVARAGVASTVSLTKVLSFARPSGACVSSGLVHVPRRSVCAAHVCGLGQAATPLTRIANKSSLSDRREIIAL
jgi:hypothetical protein